MAAIADGFVSGDEAIRTYHCRTPGCDQEAKAPTGRASYCDRCRIEKRGTMTPDGRPLRGGGARNGAAPKPESAASVAGDSPDDLDDDPEGSPSSASFEARALVLVEAARGVDAAIEQFKHARPALEQAVAAWRAALAEVATADVSGSVPASRNGASHAASGDDAD